MRRQLSPLSPDPERPVVAALAIAALAVLLTACSAERPTLAPTTVPAESVGGTTTVPVPQRQHCDTVVGPGPGVLTLRAPAESDAASDAATASDGEAAEDQLPPCLVVAAHHRLELVNASGGPLEVAFGAAGIALAGDERQLTGPAGESLTPGPNRLQAGTETVGFVLVVDPVDDPLAGSPIGLASIGGIELGQGPAGVTAAAGVPVPAAGATCYQASLEGDPYSPLFTFRDGSLVVVQVFTPGLATLSGIRIGSTAADITAAYGERVGAQPAPDGDPARQLMVFSPADEESQIYRLVFDLTDDRVTTMRFGATEIVATSPGC